MAQEHTSAEIAAIAARVLGMSDADLAKFAAEAPHLVRRLAGSALTQARDHGAPVDTTVGDREPVGGDSPDGAEI